MGDLCRLIEDRKKVNGDKMEGFQGIVEFTILFCRLQRGVVHEIAIPSARIGQCVQEYTSKL